MIDRPRCVGNVVHAGIDVVHAPRGDLQVIAKVRDLMAPVLGAERCDKLIQATMGMEGLKSVRDLRPLLQRA